MSIKTYKIYAALHQDSKEGWIWVSPNPELTNEYVQVRNPKNRKTVVCEHRNIDSNFRQYYNSRSNTIKIPDSGNFIVINETIRNKLGRIPTQSEIPLEVVNATRVWDRYVRAFLHHPHPAIRVGIILGLTSVALGIVGFILGLISLLK